MHLAAVRQHPEATFARSGWQGFDMRAELQRLQQGPRDTFVAVEQEAPVGEEAQAKPRLLKPLNQLVHERMAERPFMPVGCFNLETFVDHGRRFYGNNLGVDDRGKQFVTRRGR
jgi:hypothetical protein